MAVYLYGNIDGKVYQPKEFDAFAMAKKQEDQPKRVKEAGTKTIGSEIKVDISKEGLRALHGSKLTGSMDYAAYKETAKQIAYMTEHQPIESFTSRFSGVMLSNYEKAENGEYQYVSHSIQEKADALLKGFGEIYEEVCKGYEDGTRIRYIEDDSSEDGFRKLTKEEELDILKKEFDEFVDYRFGPKRQKESEAVTDAMNKLQKIKQSMGRGDIRFYKPEIIPDGFAEQIKNSALKMMEK